MTNKYFFFVAFSAIAVTLMGCAVPNYDVRYSASNQPTITSIDERIQCELRDMVRNDQPTDPNTFHRGFLLDGDYEVEASLSIETNNTGGLVPTLAFIEPLKAATSFAFGGAGTLSESRDHTFTVNLRYSIRDIFLDWRDGVNPHDCPRPDTELAGTLGLNDFVAMAATLPSTDNTVNLTSKGVFGGTIQFVITKSVTALGPTWTLVNFKNSGGATLSQVNTDKLVAAFALGPKAGTRLPPPGQRPLRLAKRPDNVNAYIFLQQLLTGGISSQLSIIQNGLLPR